MSNCVCNHHRVCNRHRHCVCNRHSHRHCHCVCLCACTDTVSVSVCASVSVSVCDSVWHRVVPSETMCDRYLTMCDRYLTVCDRYLTSFDVFWPIFEQFWRLLTDFGPISDDFDRFLMIFGEYWPISDDFRWILMIIDPVMDPEGYHGAPQWSVPQPRTPLPGYPTTLHPRVTSWWLQYTTGSAVSSVFTRLLLVSTLRSVNPLVQPKWLKSLFFINFIKKSKKWVNFSLHFC